VSVLPQLTPDTDLGAATVAAYAERAGVEVDVFVKGLVPALTPEQVGAGVRDIATGQHSGHNAYALTSTGLSPVSWLTERGDDLALEKFDTGPVVGRLREVADDVFAAEVAQSLHRGDHLLRCAGA
jgi:hypothetical protein